MGTDQFPFWEPPGSPDILGDLFNSKQSLELFLQGDAGAVLADSPTSDVSPHANWSVDQDRWKSSSTSSSHGDCNAEEPRFPVHVTGVRKPHAAKAVHAQDEAYQVAREKNKAAQRAYRLRTKVALCPRITSQLGWFSFHQGR